MAIKKEYFNILIDEEIYGIEATILKDSFLFKIHNTPHLTLKYHPFTRIILENKLRWNPDLKERLLESFPILVGK